MNIKRFAALAAFAAVVSFGGFAAAQPVIDGTKDAMLYGDAVGVQTVNTEFGDEMGSNTGSELDAAYVSICDGRLYMIITGNLQTNFNKLHIFFDTQEGVGENVMSPLPEYDFFNGTDWISTFFGSLTGGLTFDAGFTAQYHMFVRSGGETAGTYEVDWIDRLLGTSTVVNGNAGASAGLGTVAIGSLANNAAASALTNDISFFFDNSNVLGVTGGNTAAVTADALAVTTGFEFSIDFADLGLDPKVANTIRVAAMIGNGDNGFLSNQTLGGLPAPFGNVGGPYSGIDFTAAAFAGDQFMTIVLPAKGDANDDGVVNSFDIASFGQALFMRPAYDIMFPGVDADVQLDMNCDGVLNSFDIPGFGTALGF